MEKQVAFPFARYGLSAVIAVVSLTLLLSHPDLHLLMAIFAFVGFFGILALTLPDRVHHSDPSSRSQGSVRDGGNRVSAPARQQRTGGAPLKSSDGGSFPVRLSKLTHKR